jgi:tetratricopeptide (TPR) repeat protein
MALEFCPGGSLAERLAGTPLPQRQAAELAEALARAADHAHAAGVIHRDLKPANVLLRGGESPPSLDPLISDFGLARRLDGDSGLTHAGSLLGTPSYMPPEQADGKEVGPAADVYSLGTILYECLTGRPPFKGADPLDTLVQVRTREPVPPRALQPNTPRDLETITLKCLDKQIAKRYASAGALADDLRRYLDGRPIVARPVGPLGRAAKWAKRRPAAAGLIAVSVLASAALVTGGAVYSLRLAAANESEREQRGKAEQALAAVEDAALELGRLAFAEMNRTDQTVLTPAALERVDATVAVYEKMVALRPDNADLWRQLGKFYFVRNRTDETEETFEKARAAYQKALDIREARASAESTGAEARLELAGETQSLASLLTARGRFDDAGPLFRRAIELLDGLTDEFPDDPRFRTERAYGQIAVGRFEWARGRNRAALDWSVPGMAVLEADLRSPRRDPKAFVCLIDARAACADASARLGLWGDALKYWDGALTDPTLPARLRWQFGLSRARVLAELGRCDEVPAQVKRSEGTPGHKKPCPPVELAAIYAVCARHTARSGGSPERYAAEAVAQLRAAIDKGELKSRADFERLRQDSPAFDDLRDRADFREWFDSLP